MTISLAIIYFCAHSMIY